MKLGGRSGQVRIRMNYPLLALMSWLPSISSPQTNGRQTKALSQTWVDAEVGHLSKLSVSCYLSALFG